MNVFVNICKHDIYTLDQIRYVKSIQNHPEYVATTLYQAGRVKKNVIIGVGNPDD